jgi:antitoxin CptB
LAPRKPPSGRFRVFVRNGEVQTMPESTLSSANLDPRRRRILMRAWRRGMREMDYIMGGFADAHLPTLDESELDQFEALLGPPDRDVLMWLTGEAPTPDEYMTPLFRKLKAFHTHTSPINV